MFDGLLQPTHLVLVLVVALIVLGPGKLGDLGGQLGRGVREFKSNMEGSDTDRPALGSGASRFCTKCGATNASTTRFCSQCGTPSEVASAE